MSCCVYWVHSLYGIKHWVRPGSASVQSWMHSAGSYWEGILISSKLLRALLLQGDHEELGVFRGKEEKGWKLGWPNFGWVGIQTQHRLTPLCSFLLLSSPSSHTVPHLHRYELPQPLRRAGTPLLRSCYPQSVGLVPGLRQPWKSQVSPPGYLGLLWLDYGDSCSVITVPLFCFVFTGMSLQSHNPISLGSWISLLMPVMKTIFLWKVMPPNTWILHDNFYWLYKTADLLKASCFWRSVWPVIWLV